MNAILARLLPWLARSDAAQLRDEGGIRIDPILLLAAAALLAWGLVMVTSASMELGEQFGNPFHFVIRQGFAVFVGLVAVMFIVLRMPISFWVEYKAAILIASFDGRCKGTNDGFVVVLL